MLLHGEHQSNQCKPCNEQPVAYIGTIPLPSTQSNAVEADEDMQGCIDGVSKEEKNVHDYYHMHILPTISTVSRPEPFQTWEACEMIQGCP